MTDQRQAFLDLIRSEPHVDAHRLTFSDYLDDYPESDNDHEWAEFIRVQCELAPVLEPHVCGFNHGAKACWVCRLRRREAELLSATTSEPCPRCKGSGSIRLQTDHRRTRGWNCVTCYGKKVVQVPNCVRWAGKLGGREIVAGADDIADMARVFWHMPDPLQSLPNAVSVVVGRFSRGFIGSVSLSCAALVGELCERCGGEGGWEGNPGCNRCPDCHGSGYVGGVAAELARFPLTECRLSDKRPEEWGQSQRVESWSWYKMGLRDDPATLPAELFDLLEGDTWVTGQMAERKIFASASAAQEALSDACVRYIRQQAKVLQEA